MYDTSARTVCKPELYQENNFQPPKKPVPFMHLTSAILDTLLYILVDSSPALCTFEEVNGIQAVVKILKQAGTPCEVSIWILVHSGIFQLLDPSQLQSIIPVGLVLTLLQVQFLEPKLSSIPKYDLVTLQLVVRCAGSHPFEVLTRFRSLTKSVTATKVLVLYQMLRPVYNFASSWTSKNSLYSSKLNYWVYSGDLWEIVVECTIEVKQEAILQQYQSIWVGQRRHVILEHLLIEERKKQGQMEVSLYSQAIDHLQQHEMCYVREMTSEIFNCISPSLTLLNTWVTTNVQELFCDALHAKQACQTGLMAQMLATQNNNSYKCNIRLEFLILHAKMCCTQAETDLYTMAIEHACEFDFLDNISVTSSPSRFMLPPLPDKLCYYHRDLDDEADDLDSEFS
ncbi:hypothetical protein BDR06DRAFT_968731 [Suillus hirtellus]|nr:hypothetical protein BDR06DRAFT_968731 [Suillus hirtellus]